jgi:hypothetical protein
MKSSMNPTTPMPVMSISTSTPEAVGLLSVANFAVR